MKCKRYQIIAKYKNYTYQYNILKHFQKEQKNIEKWNKIFKTNLNLNLNIKSKNKNKSKNKRRKEKQPFFNKKENNAYNKEICFVNGKIEIKYKELNIMERQRLIT